MCVYVSIYLSLTSTHTNPLPPSLPLSPPPLQVPLDGSLELVLPEGAVALQYCLQNPVILHKILLFAGTFAHVYTYLSVSVHSTLARPLTPFAACSAMGQAFIFYTISNFDPLTTTTITTTRKVSSTVLSILTEGHSLSGFGWCGLSVASAGISMEIVEKVGASGGSQKEKAPTKKVT